MRWREYTFPIHMHSQVSTLSRYYAADKWSVSNLSLYSACSGTKKQRRLQFRSNAFYAADEWSVSNLPLWSTISSQFHFILPVTPTWFVSIMQVQHIRLIKPYFVNKKIPRCYVVMLACHSRLISYASSTPNPHQLFQISLYLFSSVHVYSRCVVTMIGGSKPATAVCPNPHQLIQISNADIKGDACRAQ
jgi:hypothetical protein